MSIFKCHFVNLASVLIVTFFKQVAAKRGKTILLSKERGEAVMACDGFDDGRGWRFQCKGSYPILLRVMCCNFLVYFS